MWQPGLFLSKYFFLPLMLVCQHVPCDGLATKNPQSRLGWTPAYLTATLMRISVLEHGWMNKSTCRQMGFHWKVSSNSTQRVQTLFSIGRILSDQPVLMRVLLHFLPFGSAGSSYFCFLPGGHNCLFWTLSKHRPWHIIYLHHTDGWKDILSPPSRPTKHCVPWQYKHRSTDKKKEQAL